MFCCSFSLVLCMFCCSFSIIYVVIDWFVWVHSQLTLPYRRPHRNAHLPCQQCMHLATSHFPVASAHQRTCNPFNIGPPTLEDLRRLPLGGISHIQPAPLACSSQREGKNDPPQHETADYGRFSWSLAVWFLQTAVRKSLSSIDISYFRQFRQLIIQVESHLQTSWEFQDDTQRTSSFHKAGLRLCCAYLSISNY